MKRTHLKYYLRALGIGIIVTALLMGYSQRGQAQMTDEEIRQRAAELGMAERQGTLLSDIATPTPTEAPAASPTAVPAASPTAVPAEMPTEAPTADSGTTPTPMETPTAVPTAAFTASPAETPAEAADAGDTVTLVISRGESSMAVSRNLQELGLVEDYGAYDRFLCDNGYDHYLCAGVHEIPLDATDEEIAQIISKKR